jgi:hypothetical protein
VARAAPCLETREHKGPRIDELVLKHLRRQAAEKR